MKFINERINPPLKEFPMNPPLPFIVSQKESDKNAEKNTDPIKQYKIVKNKFSIRINIFLFLNIFNPVKKIVIGIKKEIKPID